MSKILDINDLAMAADEYGLPDPPTFGNSIAMAQAIAEQLAEHLGIEIRQPAENIPAMGGLCVSFGPRYIGQPCPEYIDDKDEGGEWEWEPTEGAWHIFTKLSDEDIQYAGDPARGQYRGFAALHDRMDANMLLPMLGHPESLDTREKLDTHCDFSNQVMPLVTDLIIKEWEKKNQK